MVGAGEPAPLVVSLPKPVAQGQLERFLLLPPVWPPASFIPPPPSSYLLPGDSFLLEVTGGAGVVDEAGGGEAGEDTVRCLHHATGALEVELVGVIVLPGVTPSGQLLDLGMNTMWF